MLAVEVVQPGSFRPPLISKGLNPAAAAALAAGLGKCCVNEEKAVSGFVVSALGLGGNCLPEIWAYKSLFMIRP